MKKKTKNNEALQGWALLMSSLIFMVVFTFFPVVRSLYLSFTKFKLGGGAPEWIGLANYIKLFGSPLFWKVFRNTIYFAVITVFPSMVIGLGFASLVNRKGKHIGFIRTAYFYPVVMPMIAIASVWMFIYMPKNGLLDQLLTSLGFSNANVLSNKQTVLPAMAVMYVWKEAGYMMVFFYLAYKVFLKMY